MQEPKSLQQHYQQQGYPNNMVNGPNHFRVVGQQNPQQQVHSNNMVNDMNLHILEIYNDV